MDKFYYIKQRLGLLRKHLLYQDLDALLVTCPHNVFYLTGIFDVEAALLITAAEQFFITDFRYIEQAKKWLAGFFKLIEIKDMFFKDLAGLISSTKSQRCGFEAKRLIFEEYAQIKKRLKKPFELVKTLDLVEGMRAIKDKNEISLIRDSVSITKAAISYANRIDKRRLTESDLSLRLDRYIGLKGAKKAFDIIAASGPNSSLPHAPVTSKIIGHNTMLLIDLGSNYKGYASDLTRVYILGKIKSLYKKLISIVDTAQKMAIDAIRPGIEASLVDAAGRSYIHSKGYGKFFGHSLGHGIGLEVHEAPHISAKSKDMLKEGMVFTIEPAVYIPKTFGVRIEDMVLVTNKGCEVISR